MSNTGRPLLYASLEGFREFTYVRACVRTILHYSSHMSRLTRNNRVTFTFILAGLTHERVTVRRSCTVMKDSSKHTRVVRRDNNYDMHYDARSFVRTKERTRATCRVSEKNRIPPDTL